MVSRKGTIFVHIARLRSSRNCAGERAAGCGRETANRIDEKGETMDVYDYAMQLEKDGESYYRDGAARSVNKGIRHILNMLADAEVKHYNILNQMREGASVELGEATILQD